jgi:hypothetical protein
MRCPLALNHSVMAGLVPAIHVFLATAKTWMPGTRPGMTECVVKSSGNRFSVALPFAFTV